MAVAVTPETEQHILRWIESGRYPDAGAVIDGALEALESQERSRFEDFRELVRAGFNSGPAEELTDELWDEIERSSEERFQRGERPSPHVCP